MEDPLLCFANFLESRYGAYHLHRPRSPLSRSSPQMSPSSSSSLLSKQKYGCNLLGLVAMGELAWVCCYSRAKIRLVLTGLSCKPVEFCHKLWWVQVGFVGTVDGQSWNSMECLCDTNNLEDENSWHFAFILASSKINLRCIFIYLKSVRHLSFIYLSSFALTKNT